MFPFDAIRQMWVQKALRYLDVNEIKPDLSISVLILLSEQEYLLTTSQFGHNFTASIAQVPVYILIRLSRTCSKM